MPGVAVAFLGPTDIAGVEPVAQGEQGLQGEIGGEGGQRGFGQARDGGDLVAGVRPADRSADPNW